MSDLSRKDGSGLAPRNHLGLAHDDFGLFDRGDVDEAEAVVWYTRGYNFEAKRLGLLDETGVLGRKVWPD